MQSRGTFRSRRALTPTVHLDGILLPALRRLKLGRVALDLRQGQLAGCSSRPASRPPPPRLHLRWRPVVGVDSAELPPQATGIAKPFEARDFNHRRDPRPDCDAPPGSPEQAPWPSKTGRTRGPERQAWDRRWFLLWLLPMPPNDPQFSFATSFAKPLEPAAGRSRPPRRSSRRPAAVVKAIAGELPGNGEGHDRRIRPDRSAVSSAARSACRPVGDASMAFGDAGMG